MIRRWFNRTFLDGEGEPKPVGVAGGLFVFGVLFSLVLLLLGEDPLIGYLFIVGTVAYTAGRSAVAPSHPVEKVAPPYIEDVEE